MHSHRWHGCRFGLDTYKLCRLLGPSLGLVPSPYVTVCWCELRTCLVMCVELLGYWVHARGICTCCRGMMGWRRTCAPELSRSVLPLPPFLHQENVSSRVESVTVIGGRPAAGAVVQLAPLLLAPLSWTLSFLRKTSHHLYIHSSVISCTQ